jgi:hypothetical protein
MTPLDNSYTAHQIDVVRYSAGEAKKVDAFLLDLIEYLEARIAKEGGSIASKKRLQILLDDVKSRMSGELVKFTDEFISEIDPFVKSELAFNDKVFSAFSSPVTPTLEQALSAINNNPLLLNGSAVDFGAYTRGWQQKEIDRIAGVISNGYYSGMTTQQIARDVIGTKSARYADGKLNLTKASAYSMAKTAVMHMSSQTKALFFEANDDIVVGEEVVATLDSRTSTYCKWADGKKYYYRDGKFPRPPYHNGCRSQTSPILSEEYAFATEGGTRPAVSGGKAERVSAETTYYEWLKAQPLSTVQSALGKTQADIFLNAGLSPAEFKAASTTQLGKPLTLKEMAARNDEIAAFLRNE